MIRMDPYIFLIECTLKGFENVKASLADYIYNYMEGVTYNGENLDAPMDLLWNVFDLGGCKEEVKTFWVNRFILSACYCLNNITENDDGRTDFVEETCFKSLEDLFYAATLALCVTYKK